MATRISHTPRPRKCPRQERAQTTVSAMLEAATRILEREGYARLTTNRVAEVAGVSIGSLYQYFPNKEAIIAELLAAHVSREAEIIGATIAGLADAPPEEAVRQLVAAYLALHRDPLAQALHRQVPSVHWGEAFWTATERVREALVIGWARHLGNDARSASLKTYVGVHAVVSLTQEVIAHDPERLCQADFVEEVVALVSCYLLPPSSRRQSTRAVKNGLRPIHG